MLVLMIVRKRSKRNCLTLGNNFARGVYLTDEMEIIKEVEHILGFLKVGLFW